MDVATRFGGRVRDALSSLDRAVGMPHGSAAAAAAVAAAGLLLAWGVTSHLNEDRIRKIIQDTRAARDLRLHLDTAALEAVEAKLLDSGKALDAELVLSKSAVELGKMVASRAITSEALVAFFARRVLTVNGTLNAVTETCFREALAEAVIVDEDLDSGSDPTGPLAGVPVSIKDQIMQKGMHATMGSAAFAARGVAAADGATIAMVRQTGAIPFVRTTTPQLLMAPETASDLWGTTNNPYDGSRTPGGSSGGEAALVGALGSPLGIGTDIGGSLRIPAAFCGLSTMKVTPQRVSLSGLVAARGAPYVDPASGKVFGFTDAIRAVWGPIGRHPDDLEAVLASMFSPLSHKLDGTAPPLLWDAAAARFAAGAKLRIGVMAEGDGFFKPSAASFRAVNDTAQALRDAGHTVVEFDSQAAQVDKAALGYLELMSADGRMRAIRSGLGGERMHSLYSKLLLASRLPRWARTALVIPLMRAMGMDRMAAVVWASRAKSVQESWVDAGLREVRRAALCRAMTEQGERLAGGPLDVVLCPSYPVPAVKHGASCDMSLASSSCFAFNYLHVPTGVITVTRVLEGEDCVAASRGEAGRDLIGKVASASLPGSAGMPMGVQVVGRPFEDEVVLRGMRAVRAAVNASREAGGPLGARLALPHVPTAPAGVPGCL